MERRGLNATAASLLGFLHEGELTGWDLVAVAQERIGNFWTLTRSQVYRELATMTEAGLVEVGEPGPRDRKPYRLTASGRAAFAQWVDRDPGLEQIRSPFLLTVMFAEHLEPGRLAQMGQAHRTLHAERLAAYEELRMRMSQLPAGQWSERDRARMATLEFGLRYEAAALDWFDALPDLMPDTP